MNIPRLIAHGAARRELRHAESPFYNVFVLWNGQVSFESVQDGGWGHGYPAHPEKYATFLLGVPREVLSGTAEEIENKLRQYSEGWDSN